MNRFLTMVVAGALLAGCGVSDNKKISELDESDWQKLCEDIEAETFTCDLGNGVTYDISFGGDDCQPEDTAGEPVEWPESCDATVGEFRDCDEAWRAALREDPCASEMPAECAFFSDCMPA